MLDHHLARFVPFQPGSPLLEMCVHLIQVALCSINLPIVYSILQMLTILRGRLICLLLFRHTTKLICAAASSGT